MKSKKRTGVTITKFPKQRKLILDVLEMGINLHFIKGLVEFNVTKALKNIEMYEKKTGKKLSFTGWFMKCVAQAASENKLVHAFMKGRKKIYTFDDVDIAMLLEHKVDKMALPLPLIIRKVNEKTVEKITEEIRKAQNQEVEKEQLLGENKQTKLQRVFIQFPRFLRKFFYWIFNHNPILKKQFAGTVLVTSVGMFAKISGWAIPINALPLSITLASIVKKPVVKEDEIVIGDILHATIMLNHDLLDGAPAAKFAARLQELVESGYNLPE